MRKNYPLVRVKKKSIKVPSFQVLPPKSGTLVTTLCTLPRRQITQLHSQRALAVLPLYISFLKNKNLLENSSNYPFKALCLSSLDNSVQDFGILSTVC